MNWSNRNALATVLAVSLAVGPAVAYAQVTTPEEVPEQPDEPLPEWHPPPARRDIVHLDVAPALNKAHDLRQAGLWLISIGGALAVAGFTCFGVGQARIGLYHKKHPRDPLPPLSGYDQVVK